MPHEKNNSYVNVKYSEMVQQQERFVVYLYALNVKRYHHTLA